MHYPSFRPVMAPGGLVGVRPLAGGRGAERPAARHAAAGTAARRRARALALHARTGHALRLAQGTTGLLATSAYNKLGLLKKSFSSFFLSSQERVYSKINKHFNISNSHKHFFTFY